MIFERRRLLTQSEIINAHTQLTKKKSTKIQHEEFGIYFSEISCD